MNPSNPAYALKEYINVHFSECCGSWEYVHTPHIESVLNEMNDLETQEFSSTVWAWNDNLLYTLVDPIMCSINVHLDADLIYCKIFAKLDEADYLVDMASNLQESIQGLKMETCSRELLEKMRDNLFFIINKTNHFSNIDHYTTIIYFLETEINKK